MGGLFGTSGIRGVFGTEVTLGLAARVGLALGHAGARVVVARDTRASGVALERALTAGALTAGADVINIGMAPTPTLGHATRRFSALGAMITASHNPPEYNGIKIFEKGAEACLAREREVERRVGLKGMGRVRWDRIGAEVVYDSAVRDHLDIILKQVDRPKIERKRPKVLVDAGNGAGCALSPFALREAGCHVVGVNCEPSPWFARGLEPNAGNLADFSKLVRACKADMGIAHDGDGDRAIILDEKGEMLGLDAQLALMCEAELERRSGTVVTTVEASLAVREAIERHGGKAAIVPVGSRVVAERIARTKGAVFGGEPCGEYVYPKAGMLADGMLAALKFAELLCEKGRLGSLRQTVRTHPIRRGKYMCRDRAGAMKKVGAALGKLKGKRNASDGIRLDFPHSWVLVRPSGTEPVIRITCEAREERECRELYSRVEKIVRKAL